MCGTMRGSASTASGAMPPTRCRPESGAPSSRRRGRRAPDLRFFAETLGCTADQVVALADAGFDYIFNSAKWWDFRAPWLLDQYERFRLIAPSIAFPESHDTERLAAEVPSQDPS